MARLRPPPADPDESTRRAIAGDARGSTFRLRPAGASRSRAPVAEHGRTATPTATSRTHTVKAGETPSLIARKYGVKVDALMAANPKLDPRRMQVGQALIIPAP